MLKDNGENRDFSVRMYVSDISYDDAFFDGWFEKMPAARKERTLRFKRRSDRNRSICAYALLMHGLGDLFGRTMEGSDIRISHSPSGKPFFEGLPVCFNISHSKDRVAVALSPKEVGCDVECKSDGALKIAKRFFTADERAFLERIGEEAEVQHQFKRIWTLKESVVKCCGDGIRRSFDDFSLVDKEGRRKSIVSLSGQEDIYHVKEYACEDIYCYSVCSLHDDFEDSIRRVRL